jgi:RNA polymerase sigma factor (sigma-70 family)
MVSSDESQLIRALLTQDLNWLHSRLHGWLRPRLQVLASMKGLPADLIDDVYQDVLLKLYRKGARYDSSYHRPHAWILQLAKRTLIDAIRSEQRHQRFRQQAANPGRAERAKTLEPADGRGVVRWQRAEWLLCRALEEVPRHEHRQVIRARLDRVPQKEVAAKYNIPSNTVGVIFNRFKRRVMQLLEQEVVGYLG